MSDRQIRRYVWKLYPNPEQLNALHTQRRMMAELWNALLQRREDVYRREHRTLTRFDLEYEITALYRECPEWRALSTWSARRVNVSLDLAFQAFFRRLKQGCDAAGYPRYKKVAAGDRIPHRSASGCRLLPAPRERSRDGANTDSARNRNFALRVKGIPGIIHARGKYPSQPIDYLDADILWRDDRWWFSICVEMEPERDSGADNLNIVFDCLDELAWVNDKAWTPEAFRRLQVMQDDLDRMKSHRDQRWPRPAPHDEDWREETNCISRLAARIARCRHDVLHVWTARVVHCAKSITVTAPKIKNFTASPRGDERSWGANVETVSNLNRNTLSYAPAMAIQMLKYKAQEAGIRCDVIEDPAPKIAVSEKLVAAGKALRKMKRAMRTNDDEHYRQRTGGSGRSDRGSNSSRERGSRPQGRPEAGQTGI